MAQRLFLLDGMALVYRAHFAFANRPIRTSQGFNTSALFGFTSTLLDILQNWNPTHLAVALDTPAPTPRHIWFPEYKAQREAMPEELSAALPHLRRLLDAFRIPVLALDGYEADDVIGTLVTRAEPAGFESYMVTSDKDFGQLVTEKTLLWRPGRQGNRSSPSPSSTQLPPTCTRDTAPSCTAMRASTWPGRPTSSPCSTANSASGAASRTPSPTR